MLLNLYDLISIITTEKIDECVIERAVAGCLMLLCGGHTGCRKHVTHEEEFRMQMESLIIFNHAKNLLTGQTALRDSVPLKTHLALA